LFIVVNCFHFSVSLGYNTTKVSSLDYYGWLWIAFIFRYLWDTTQLDDERVKAKFSCELLSFLGIFGIQHNPPPFLKSIGVVVNCFHF